MTARISAVALLLSCTLACSASSRSSALTTAFITATASEHAFVAYDSTRQADIVAKATSLDDGKAQLVVYRVKQAKVVKAFVAVFTAIAVAGHVNDDPSMATVQRALIDLLAAYNELTGEKK